MTVQTKTVQTKTIYWNGGTTGVKTCTGLAATWCPRCGSCTCPQKASGERSLNGNDCPLHGPASDHADAEVPSDATAEAPTAEHSERLAGDLWDMPAEAPDPSEVAAAMAEEFEPLAPGHFIHDDPEDEPEENKGQASPADVARRLADVEGAARDARDWLAEALDLMRRELEDITGASQTPHERWLAEKLGLLAEPLQLAHQRLEAMGLGDGDPDAELAEVLDA